MASCNGEQGLQKKHEKIMTSSSKKIHPKKTIAGFSGGFFSSLQNDLQSDFSANQSCDTQSHKNPCSEYLHRKNDAFSFSNQKITVPSLMKP